VGRRVHSHDYEEAMKKFVRDWYVTIIPIVIMVALSVFMAHLIMRSDAVLGL
jgi:hypothetical protein